MDSFELDKRAVRRSFNQAAASYDAAAVLQREVCQRLMERLDIINVQPRRILDVGSGTGWGARQLSERYQEAEVIQLDSAQNMLLHARATESWWKRLFSSKHKFLCADVEALPLPFQSIDMVWSNLAVQWCNDLPATFKELHRVIHSDGLLLFSTFGPDTLKELQVAFEGIDQYKHVSRFADMHDIGDMLVEAGFADPVVEMETLVLTYDDVRSVMQDLRDIGAHNASTERVPSLMGKTKWARIIQNYETLRQDGKLPATFEVIYGHAWRVPLKQVSDGRTVIQTNFKL